MFPALRPATERVRALPRCFETSVIALVGLPFSWLVMSLFVGLSLPPVDPSLTIVRPLETLGTCALILPVTAQAALLQVRMRWLFITGARSPKVLRGWWAATSTIMGAMCCYLIASWRALPQLQFVTLWILLVALAFFALVVLGAALAPVPPFLLLAVFSFGFGFPPWRTNIVFNPELVGVLTIVALSTFAVAFAAYVRYGDRQATL